VHLLDADVGDPQLLDHPDGQTALELAERVTGHSQLELLGTLFGRAAAARPAAATARPKIPASWIRKP